jgi:hypothetical protein
VKHRDKALLALQPVPRLTAHGVHDEVRNFKRWIAQRPSA